MIKVYKSQIELFHAFIYGNESFEGRSSNVFAEGNKIYSYGYHYMLAKLEEHQGQQYILINNTHYSNDTAKQRNKLSKCIPENYIRIYVEDPKQTPRVLIQRSIGKIKEYLSKIPKTTSRKLFYLNQANYERDNILELVYLYPDQLTLADYQFLIHRHQPEEYISEDWIKKQEEKQAKHKAKEEAEAIIRKLKGDEQLVKWLNFEIDNCYNYSGLTRLRYNSKTECIETTLGINLHKDKVKELYKKLSNKEDIIGLKIEQFRVLRNVDDVIVIGCHQIDLFEILRFGKQIFGE
jgi:hypothetical protein